MILFASFIVSMLVTTLLIPVVKKLAFRLGFVDNPSSRKVHTFPMARIGGLAIILGALVPLLIWLPLDRAVIAYAAGALLIIILALLDDKYDLSPLLKLAVQSIAAGIAIFFGDLGVHQFYLFWFEFTLSTYSSLAVTVVFILTVINGVNFSDGLDGLAGGMALLSLVALMMLSYRVGASDIVLICTVLAGGLLGFLLYNSHPAQVFMGEVGSQFLGYSLAVLTVYLTQAKTHIYSAFIPLLLIGLPLVDLLVVVIGRLIKKKSPFNADRSHIHHRLLDMNLEQHGSVFILYLLQCISIGMALAFRFEGDTFVLFLFGMFTLTIGGLLFTWETRGIPGVKYVNAVIKGPINSLNKYVIRLELEKWVQLLSALAIIGYLLAGVIAVETVGLKEGLISIVLFLFLLFFQSSPSNERFPGFFIRFIFYLCTSGILFYVYLESSLLADHKLGIDAFFIMLSLLIIFGIHFSEDNRLTLRPIDFLVILLVLILPATSNESFGEQVYWMVAIHLLILFYGIELVLLSYQGSKMMKYIQYLFAIPLGVFAIRGVMSI
jgi:UDP-GlcNAc:undecaprenyl-phosphate GlcNAc-1-phosphate transferase